MPSRDTSPATTRAPNAIDAMIAALAAASKPSMSAVGIALGVPELLRLRDRGRERAALLGHAREHVVGRAVHDARSPAGCAHPPATRAAAGSAGCRRRPTPRTAGRHPTAAATSNSSSPTLASSSLFAVTTGLPAFSAVRINDRAGSTPPMTSTITSTSGAATTLLGVVREHARRERDVALLGEVLHRDARDLEPHAGAARDEVGVRVEQPDQRGADVAAPEDADPYQAVVGAPIIRPFSRIERA